MAGTMRVNPVALRLTEPRFAAISASVGEVLRRLALALDAEGTCWGDDAIGARFAQEYVPAAAQIGDGLTGLRAGVCKVGDAIRTVADNVDAAESRAQRRFG